MALVDKTQKPVSTVAQAIEEMNRLKVKRSGNDLLVLTRTPKFRYFAKTYLDFIKCGQGTKKSGTFENEESTLNGWVRRLGGIHVDEIRKVHINAYLAE